MVDANQARRLVILGTGGTIAGRAAQASDHVGYVAGQVGVGELVQAVPALAGLSLDVEQVAQVDSKDMGLPVWQALARRIAVHLERPEVSAVIVTHGTDTLEETAFVLQQLFRPGKPVVLTCAMRPASALVPDGPQNLSDAVAVARHTDAPPTTLAHPSVQRRMARELEGPRAAVWSRPPRVSTKLRAALDIDVAATRLRELEAVHRPAAPPLLTGLVDPRHSSSPLDSWRPERALATSACWPPRVRFDTSRPRRLMPRAVRRVVHHRRLSRGWQVRVV